MPIALGHGQVAADVTPIHQAHRVVLADALGHGQVAADRNWDDWAEAGEAPCKPRVPLAVALAHGQVAVGGVVRPHGHLVAVAVALGRGQVAADADAPVPTVSGPLPKVTDRLP